MAPARTQLVCSALLSALVGCRAQRPEPTPEPARAPLSPSADVPPAPKTYGAQLGAEPVLSLADVLASPERFRDQAVTVEGHVRRACTRRGCWMEVAEGTDPTLPGCRVTFKDYGFFVPTDSAGSRAKVHGTLAVNTLPPERVAHLENEGGQFPNKNSDGSAVELRLVATGVELWR